MCFFTFFIRSILLETGAMTTTTTATTMTTTTTTMMISVFRFPIEMCLFEWKTLDGKNGTPVLYLFPAIVDFCHLPEGKIPQKKSLSRVISSYVASWAAAAAATQQQLRSLLANLLVVGSNSFGYWTFFS